MDIQNIADYMDEIIKNEKGGEEIYEKEMNQLYPYQIIPFDECELYFRGIENRKVEYIVHVKCELKDFNTYWVAHDIKYLIERKHQYGAVWMYQVDRKGDVIEQTSMLLPKDNDNHPIQDEAFCEQHVQVFSPVGRTIRMAISFMNCKNIEYKDDPNKKLKLKHNKKKQIYEPKTIFKVLVIDNIKKTLKTEGNLETDGIKKALHICRGHFRDYSEDKPLFGKVVGRFWIPMHTRGKKEKGIIEKDYELKKTL